MEEKTIAAVTTILIGIVGVAVIALLVSQKADTVNVIGATSSGLSQMLACAVSPITMSGACNSLTPDVHSRITFPGVF